MATRTWQEVMAQIITTKHGDTQIRWQVATDLKLLYDTQTPTPGKQQRWVIVEPHAAANHSHPVETKSNHDRRPAQ
jgi:hypothetical protein